MLNISKKKTRSPEEKEEKLVADLHRISSTVQDGSLHSSDGEYNENPTVDFTQLLSSDGETINILIEIVSAFNVPAHDTPYVVVEFDKKVVHRTQKSASKKTLHPVWTLQTGSLFLLRNVAKEPFQKSDGLHFTVYHGWRDLIGKVHVDSETLLNGKGDRIELEIVEKHSEKNKDISIYSSDKSWLVLRFKHASQDDIDFLDFYRHHKGNTGIYKDYSFLPFHQRKPNFYKRQKKKVPGGDYKFRVKPHPDPDNKEETKWMSKDELWENANKQSKNWIEAGVGSVGKLYFELIACDNIPKLDLLTPSDPFGCIVFEDSVVETDIINDSCSPRWMSWSQRAFVFNILHPSSLLIIGIFHYAREKHVMDQLHVKVPGMIEYDPIGRVLVNISQFKSKTLYTLQYELYREKVGYDRKSMGTVTFRMRIEWNPRSAVLATFSLPPDMYASVPEESHFRLAHYTAHGTTGDHTYSLDTIYWYIQELNSYTELLEYVVKALETIIFWKGHYALEVRRRVVMLPLHSIVAFLWGIYLVENFYLFPAFLSFSIGWIFLATMEHRRKHPSKWRRCRSYYELFWILFANQVGTYSVIQNENIDAINAYKNSETENRKAREEIARRQEMLRETYTGIKQDTYVTEKMESEKYSFKAKIDLLKPYLYPIQLYLSTVIRYLRISKSIVLWDECYYAFWIVNISFLTSAILLLIPWQFIVRWTLRILVWVCLGPWMKLVDHYYYSKHYENLSLEEKLQRVEMKEKQLREQFLLSAKANIIAKEDTQKIRFLTRFLFGKYIISIPKFKQECFLDYPLPTSFSEVYKEDASAKIEPVRKIMGQHLEGDMIPKIDSLHVTGIKKQSHFGQVGKKYQTVKRASIGMVSDFTLNVKRVSERMNDDMFLHTEEKDKAIKPKRRKSIGNLLRR